MNPKRSVMIWAISAVVYLGVVILGYSLFTSLN